MDHRFGVAHQQVTARAEMAGQLLDHFALGLPLEIDQDVAAEDDVDVPVHGIGGVHQVHAHEIGQAPQLRHHSHLGARFTA
jgi:hypothetical protein